MTDTFEQILNNLNRTLTELNQTNGELPITRNYILNKPIGISFEMIQELFRVGEVYPIIQTDEGTVLDFTKELMQYLNADKVMVETDGWLSIDM